jgi:DNA-binding response OmpR family regulator
MVSGFLLVGYYPFAIFPNVGRYAAGSCFAAPVPQPQRYTCLMATPTPVQPKQVGILILDDEDNNRGALRQILDSEAWRVRLVQDPNLLLTELKSGEWSLVIANIALAGTDTPIFITLRELASVSHEEGGRIRVLYVVPEMNGSQYVGALELARTPYVLRPFHLHEFLEKVSDLLVEVKAIEAPLRQVRHEFGAMRKKKKQAGRSNAMFASRDSYSYSDEEMAEYEKQESEASRTSRSKPRTNLGGSDR